MQTEISFLGHSLFAFRFRKIRFRTRHWLICRLRRCWMFRLTGWSDREYVVTFFFYVQRMTSIAVARHGKRALTFPCRLQSRRDEKFFFSSNRSRAHAQTLVKPFNTLTVLQDTLPTSRVITNPFTDKMGSGKNSGIIRT